MLQKYQKQCKTIRFVSWKIAISLLTLKISPRSLNLIFESKFYKLHYDIGMFNKSIFKVGKKLSLETKIQYYLNASSKDRSCSIEFVFALVYFLVMWCNGSRALDLIILVMRLVLVLCLSHGVKEDTGFLS